MKPCYVGSTSRYSTQVICSDLGLVYDDKDDWPQNLLRNVDTI